MKLCDMKRAGNKDVEKDSMPTTAVAETPEYPWGLRLTLEQEQLDKLDVSKLRVGDEVNLSAVARVRGARASDERPDRICCIDLQITQLGLDDKPMLEAAFSKDDEED